MSEVRTTRRRFLQGSAAFMAGAGLAAPAFGAAAPLGPPSDRVRLGVVGLHSRGGGVMRAFLGQPGVEIAALCDVDAAVLAEEGPKVEAATGRKPALVKDFRRLLDDQDLDALVVATPDHWHAYITVAACRAGKDVYCEKPMANDIAGCRAITQAAAAYDRVVQIGQQQRSAPLWRDAIGYVQSGKLGQVRLVRAWSSWGRPPAQRPDAPAPEGVDYDLWLGPAPAHAFNESRFHGSWRWFWDYGGGLVSDWGVHLMDMLFMAYPDAAPRTISAMGGEYLGIREGGQPPDTVSIAYDFGDRLFVWEHCSWQHNGPFVSNTDDTHGIAFTGADGQMLASRHQWQVRPDAGSKTPVEAVPLGERIHNDGLGAHAADFVRCVRARETPACPPAVGEKAATLAHMGNIAYRTGRTLTWDAAANAFAGDAEANALLRNEARAPWRLPNLPTP